MKHFMNYLGMIMVVGLPLLGIPQASPAADRPIVAVSILPQKWFVEQIAGDLCSVIVLVGPGHSPATYEPTAKQMAAVQSATVYFCAGVPFENGLLPKLEAMQDVPPVHGYRPVAGVHHHGHDHGHEHDSIDPHNWLDPQTAQAIGDTICRNLSLLLPASAAVFNTNLETMKAELQILDQEIRETLAPCAGSTFFVFHPAFGHFARRYGLIQVAVEVDGHEPSARQMVGLVEEARDQGAEAIVVQPQFSSKPAEAVAQAIGAKLVTLDPLGANYPQNLKNIAHGLAGVLDCGEGEKK